MHKYQICKINFNEPDAVLAECNKRSEISYELDLLGYGDCKTKLNENGTLIYYKGKHSQVYVKYIHNGGK